MKIKAGIIIAAVVISLTLSAAAKEKGTPMMVENWGGITLPQGLYIEPGTQPTLTAAAYKYDAAAMFEKIYPIKPQTYQLVIRDGASFQYGYLLHYSTNVWEIEGAVERQMKEPGYLRNMSEQLTMKLLMEQANKAIKKGLPSGFSMKSEIAARKEKGRVFYECTIGRDLVINQKKFTELMRCIAWQHGNNVEIAVILGNDNGWENNLINVVAGVLKSAENMPKS